MASAITVSCLQRLYPPHCPSPLQRWHLSVHRHVLTLSLLHIHMHQHVLRICMHRLELRYQRCTHTHVSTRAPVPVTATLTPAPSRAVTTSRLPTCLLRHVCPLLHLPCSLKPACVRPTLMDMRHLYVQPHTRSLFCVHPSQRRHHLSTLVASAVTARAAGVHAASTMRTISGLVHSHSPFNTLPAHTAASVMHTTHTVTHAHSYAMNAGPSHVSIMRPLDASNVECVSVNIPVVVAAIIDVSVVHVQGNMLNQWPCSHASHTCAHPLTTSPMHLLAYMKTLMNMMTILVRTIFNHRNAVARHRSSTHHHDRHDSHSPSAPHSHNEHAAHSSSSPRAAPAEHQSAHASTASQPSFADQLPIDQRVSALPTLSARFTTVDSSRSRLTAIDSAITQVAAADEPVQ